MNTFLGPIERLQVQKSSIKIGEPPAQKYITEPIVAVDRLLLTTDGVVGLIGNEEIIDVHNRRHPSSKSRDGTNGISLGFTAHYRLMRSHFGEHVVTGCAGENIITNVDRRVDFEDIKSGLVILSTTGLVKLHLNVTSIITPCRTFSRYLLNSDDPDPNMLKDALRFIHGGMRGFFCAAGHSPQVVDVGDVIISVATATDGSS